MTPNSVTSKTKLAVTTAMSPSTTKTQPVPIGLVPSSFHQPKVRKPLPHTPPVSSLLAGPRGRESAHSESFSSTPKCCVEIALKEAPRSPDLTTSVTHSYRYTRNGIELFARVGKNLLARRIHPDDARLPLWRPHDMEDSESIDELSID
ncbi:hypothetical protein VP01_496g9 [Puccinia sorghi]|uniref:Uncharacterized protein n=1 Tax=Puccinia sorghi TaxID=27349 RepID=A0A0L6UNV2_9BASI|nr:hypothetical protein VP01_496g9 [Puccinia sorghi]